MGERRKHKSAWDEDDTKHLSGMSEHNSFAGNDRRLSHSSGHYHVVSESRTRKLRDDSDLPDWEPIEDRPIAPNSSFKNTQDGNEFSEGKRYFQQMSPGYGGIELRNYNDAHGYDQSHFQRNSGRVRNRSLSRDRESRRGWSRSRSRSSSRNRYDARTRDHTRSRSPMNARLSSRWSERRSVPEKSSQICRDLSAGGCRRGSQCHFLHPNTTSRRERDRMEDDITESWRGRTDQNRIPRQFYSRASSGFESQNDFPDPYHEDRRAVPYKDSLKGNNRWGDASRYSHSNDDSRPLCKFFAAGMCKNRENCRFLHVDRRGEDIDRRSRDKNNWSDTPTRVVATRTLDNSDRSGEVYNSQKHDSGNLRRRQGEITDMRSREKRNWSGDYSKIPDSNDNREGEVTERCTRDKDTWQISSCTNGTKISDTNDRRAEDTERSSHEFGSWLGDPIRGIANEISDSGNRQTDRRSEDRNKNWGIIESTLPGESMGFAEPITKENMAYKKEEFISYGSEFQDRDGMTKIDGQNALQENIYPPQIQQQHCIVNNNQMDLSGPDVLDEVKDTITTHPIPFSGHQNAGNMFPGHSSISSKTDGGLNVMLPNPPNGFCTYSNEPNTGIVDPMNVTPRTLSEHKTSQSPRFLEADLANLLAKKLSDQAALARSFLNREHPQTYSETPSFPDNSVWAPPVNAVITQPHLSTVALDPYSMENGRKNAEHDNLSTPQGTEHKQLSPLSAVGPPGFDSIKVRSEDVTANSEVNEDKIFVAEESKDVEEIKDPETQNVEKKIEEGLSVNKDEKAMRLLKNSLVLFVKDILKPTWKEGQMSRDDHKVVVRKVVDKVSSTVHADHIPKTQEKVNQYLASSKPKITKLVQAYVERSLKKKS